MVQGRSNVVGFGAPQSSLFDDEEQQSCVDDTERTDSQLGRYAEFMVCAELTKLGYYVVHVDAPGFDLILSTDTMSVRVQVKSTSSVNQGYCRWNCVTHAEAGNGGKRKVRKSRRLSRADTDLVALFHHVFGTTVFMLVTEACTSGVRLPAHHPS